jgi:hypothetical protein
MRPFDGKKLSSESECDMRCVREKRKAKVFRRILNGAAWIEKLKMLSANVCERFKMFATAFTKHID